MTVDEEREQLIRDLLADPRLGHPDDEFHLVEYLVDLPEDDDPAEGWEHLREIVVFADDEEHLADLQDRYDGVGQIRVLLSEEGNGGQILARSGPFGSVLSALYSSDDVLALIGPTGGAVTSGDPRLLDEITDPALREHVAAGLRTTILDSTGFYLDGVPEAFPDFDVVVEFSAVPPLQEVAFCVLRRRRPR
jgi:hypothetical protein